MESTPYRDHDKKPSSPPPSTLTIPWKNGEETTSAVAVFQLSLWAVLVFCLMASEVPWAAAVVVVLSAGYWWWRRSTRLPASIDLAIEGSTLLVPTTTRDVSEPVALADIDNVEIEHKAIERVSLQQGISDGIATNQVGPKVSLGRVVLVRAGGGRLVLRETYEHDFVCVDAFGKVRKFLRAHGWRPLDEREASDAGAPRRD